MKPLGRPGRFVVVALGPLPRGVLAGVAAGLREVYGLEVVLGDAQQSPTFAFNEARRQFHSTAILRRLAASRGAVEVNGDPKRLELEPRWLRAARSRGIPVVLSVDAHSTRDLGYLRYAVATARRGWVRRGDVLNTLPVERFRAAVRPVA